MDSTFLLAALTIIVGALIFIVRSLFASKCTTVKCGWGCLKVTRDVDVEMSDIRQSPTKNVESKHELRVVTNSRSNSPVQFALDEESDN